MTKVLVTQSKLDTLSEIIGGKSNTEVPLTLDEMITAADSITSGGGITPTGNINITSAGVTDVTNYATATVPSATYELETSGGFYTESGIRKFRIRPDLTTDPEDASVNEGWVDEGTFHGDYNIYNAVPSNTTITPTESSQTIGGANYMMEGAVLVEAIESEYVGSEVPRCGVNDISFDTEAGIYKVIASDGFYESGVSKAVPTGTEGTPSATKGTVSNHSVTVTPSVTNTAGYISGGTHSGTAVSISASELVSGSETKTINGTYDVTNLAELVVDVSGGGSSMIVATTTKTLTSAASSISFTGLSGEPTSFVIRSSADQTTGGTKVVGVVYDGTSCLGIDLTTQAANDTGFTQSYSNGTLTVTATTASFQANEYSLVYSYGGSAANIGTADIQVGSGTTSITFTGLKDEPEYFSCIFKSTFSTSSGYQRVMDVVYDGTSIYGNALDSSAKALTSWSYTYNNGSLTISSTGTNNGGYFHQPGYYQLTYGIGGAVELDIQPLSVTENGTYQQNGIAYSPVVVNVSGGGSSSKNVQVLQSTSRISASSLTKALGDLTVSKTGTYDIYWSGGRSNTSTSYTWGTRLYIDGSGYGTENTTWTNNCQSNHLSDVSLTANQELSVYARGRTGSYYTFVPMLVIIEK